MLMMANQLFLISVIYLPEFSSFLSPLHSHTLSLQIPALTPRSLILSFHLSQSSYLGHIGLLTLPNSSRLPISQVPKIPFLQAQSASQHCLKLTKPTLFLSDHLNCHLFSQTKHWRHQIIQACTCSQIQNSFLHVQATVYQGFLEVER